MNKTTTVFNKQMQDEKRYNKIDDICGVNKIGEEGKEIIRKDLKKYLFNGKNYTDYTNEECIQALNLIPKYKPSKEVLDEISRLEGRTIEYKTSMFIKITKKEKEFIENRMEELKIK